MQGVGAANSMQSFASACVAVHAITCVARHTLAIVCEKARGCDDHPVIVPARHAQAAYRAAIHYILLTAVWVRVRVRVG